MIVKKGQTVKTVKKERCWLSQNEHTSRCKRRSCWRHNVLYLNLRRRCDVSSPVLRPPLTWGRTKNETMGGAGSGCKFNLAGRKHFDSSNHV